MSFDVLLTLTAMAALPPRSMKDGCNCVFLRYIRNMPLAQIKQALIAIILVVTGTVSNLGFAATYTLPNGTLPSGCTKVSNTSVTCSSLTLAWADTVVVTEVNLTLTISNTLEVAGNDINFINPASGFVVQAKKFTGGSAVKLNGNILADQKVTIGNASVITGAITSSDEVVLLPANTVVTGNITAGKKVTLGSSCKVTGDITTDDEVILESSGSSVTGNINAKKKVTLGSSCAVTGDIVTDDEVVLQSSSSTVTGNIAAKKKVTLESSTSVTGNVTSLIGDVELKSSSASVSQCVTVDSNQYIILGWNASVGGVCCLSGGAGGTCSATGCVKNDSGKPDPSACTAPLACIVDNFSSGTLNPALWNAAAVSGTFVPTVVDVGGSKRLRLTQAVTNQSTMTQLKKWYPGAGNKIVVEFDYYVYGGNGADGVTVVFSDASKSPAAGGFGGSLGYAQRSVGINGFGGGWLGVGLDEFGNFPSTGEGRTGYPTGYTPPAGANQPAKAYKNNISVRGSGSGTTGYPLLANTGTLATPIWKSANTSSTVQRFRITIDHSDSIHAYVSVERDLSGNGSSYSTLVPAFDAKASSTQAAVPANWLVSFTGSTGGSHNIHELTNLSICATYVTDPGTGTPAANFECMDGYLAEASYNDLSPMPTPAKRNPIYTKLARAPFDLRVVPLAADGSIKADYIPSGGTSKNVTVELFDDTASPRPACSAFSSPVATQTATLVSGVMKTGNFTVNKAYPKLICRVTDNEIPASPVYGCSSDAFAVRPGVVTLTPTLASATGPSASATPVVKAGANFTLRATTSTNASDAYSGVLTQDTSKLTAQITTQDTSQASGGVVGALAPASLTANAAAVNATYSEVGYLYLAASAYRDSTFTAIDGSTDCVGGSNSVTLSSGKYGCVIGNSAPLSLGRFIPDRFAVLSPAFTPGCGTFTYMGQSFALSATVQAQDQAGGKTSNFSGVFASAAVDPELENANDGVSLSVARLTGLGSPSWTAGEYLFVATGLSRLSSPDGAYDNLDIGLIVSPTYASDTTRLINRDMAASNTTCTADPAGTSSGTCSAVRVATAAKLRFGRLRLQNAFGSDKLPLAVPVQAQYWSGSYFENNALDNCTALTVPAAQTLATGASPGGAAGLYFYPVVTGKNQLLSTDTVPTLVSPLLAGKSSLQFPAPQKSGWLDIILQVPDYLLGNWGNCSGQTGAAGLIDDLPCARATFGVYGSKSPIIYRRENY